MVAGHNHFNAVGEFDGAGNVRGTEIELRTITVNERGVTAAFIFRQDVNLSGEFGVGMNRAGFCENLSSFDFFTVDTAEKSTDVIACVCVIEKFTEHFDTGDNGFFLFGGKTDDFCFVLNLDLTTFNTARSNGSATGDGENVFDRHKEGLVGVAFGSGDIAVYRVKEFLNAFGCGIVNSAVEKSLHSKSAEPRMIGVSSPGKS